MNVLRFADYHRMPWKNGGGETTEIVVSPKGAGLADFDWRISMALVNADGPFSLFPGIERTLSILDGEGIALTVDSLTHELTQASVPLLFPGDASAHAVLRDGPITDLNVMCRRAGFRHTVQRVSLQDGESFALETAVTAVFCHRGSVVAASPQSEVTLGAGDTALNDATMWTLAAKSAATVFIITITPIRA